MTKISKTKLFKPLFLAVGFLMLTATIFMAVGIATSGAEISKLENDIFRLEEVNKTLSRELIKNSSVSAIDGAAASLGFAKPEKTVYLTVRGEASAYVR